MSTLKKGQKWTNGKTILFLANSFKKGQVWQSWPLRRPNGNPDCNLDTLLLLIFGMAHGSLLYVRTDVFGLCFEQSVASCISWLYRLLCTRSES